MANRFDFLKIPQLTAPQFLTGKEGIIEAAARLGTKTREQVGRPFAKTVIGAGRTVVPPILETLNLPAALVEEVVGKGAEPGTVRKEILAPVAGFGAALIIPGPDELLSAKKATTALEKLIGAIKQAKPAQAELKVLQTAERAKRVGAATEVLKVAKGEEAFIKAKGKLKGELVPEEAKPRFEPLEAKAPTPGKLIKTDAEELVNMINETPYLTTFEKISTFDGFNDILQGRIPQPHKISLLEQVFGADLTEAVLQHRPFLEKLSSFGQNLANLPRAIMSSLDLSFGGRQGIFAAPKYRKEFWDSWKKQFGAFGSEKAAQKIAKEVADNPDYLLAKDSGIAFTKLGNLIAEREERFASAWGDRIPIVKQSARAYNAFANKFRMDIFSSMIRDARAVGLNPQENKELAQGIANFVNIATGRGPIPKVLGLEKAAGFLNAIFFSPRLMFSRLSLLNPKTYITADPFVRKQALRSLLGFGSYIVTVLSLAKLSGAEVETDPRSADFMKIKIGNTRFDIMGGFQQYIRMAAQLVTGQYISTVTGKQITLGEGYKPITRYDILLRQIESKTSPVASFALDLLKQQTPTGESVEVSKELVERFTPIIIQDLRDIAKDDPELLPWALIGIFGVGIQTYKSKKQVNRFNF